MRRRPLLPLILIPLLALVVVLPLILQGCSCGHDFDFHLISWMEAAAQFQAGAWHPAWAFSPAWNAGEPRFVFYPPLSWTVGALLGMAMPWGAVPIAFTWMAVTAAGFAMYWLSAEITGANRSAGVVITAAIYMANPYMIFTAYERTAYAELLAAAWIPLLLAAVLRERVTVLRIAVPVALLWLTNAPAAVMGCYTLALLAAVRLVLMWRPNTWRACLALASRLIGGVALGLGLAAFYILPAAYERRWVQIAMAMVSGMRIGDNFLFHHTGDGPHDEVLHTASMIAVMIFSITVAALAVAWMQLRKERAEHNPRKKCVIIQLAALLLAIGFLLTPLSAAVWRIAPEMAFLQFPWRWTAVLAAALSGGVALATETLRPTRTFLALGTLALVVVMALPAVHGFRQECDDEDSVAARVANFLAKTGTDPTDEYTPGDADNDALQHANPGFWLADDADTQPPQRDAGQVPMHFAVHTDRAKTLILNLRAYPAWRVSRDGALVEERSERADGLIAFPVPAGSSHIDIAYATTGDVKLGDGITLAALCGTLGIVATGRTRRRSGIINA
jgi:uncharacterized membrane protein